MIKLKGFLPVLLLLLAAACTMPATRIYSVFLPLENIPGGQSGIASITISVDAEDHLLQPYIVHRSSPYKYRILKHSKWEASPRKLVKEALRNAFFLTGTFHSVKTAGINRKNSCFLKVNLKRFERVGEGNDLYGIIEMDMKLWSPENEELYFKTVFSKERLSGDDLSGLAKQLSASLEEAIEEVRMEIIHVVEARNDPGR